MTFVIGVTGNIACGKSLILTLLADLGAATIDADSVYHDLIRPGLPLWTQLKRRFGENVVGSDGQIDRRALGAIVFTDAAALADLDALTHPAVIAEIKRRLAASSAAVTAVDAVKLYESGMDEICDQVWLVTCSPEAQLKRLMERNSLSRDDAQRRMDAQPPIESKRLRASLVIDNSGTREDTARQVRQAWSRRPILPS